MSEQDRAVVELKTRSETDKIALRGVRLRADLVGMEQKTTLEQTFVNMEDKPIEAVYSFPLPENAAVCNFEVITDERVLTGAVEEKEAAIEQYDEAAREGHGAFLLEQIRPDVFTVYVGNLKPSQAVTIRLTYVSPLDVVDRAIRMAFPTTIAPRYVTASGMDPMQAILDGDAMNPTHQLHVPYGLTMEVRVDLGRSVQVTSPSHRIEAHGHPESGYRVTLEEGVTEMNRDVVLELAMACDPEPRVQYGRDDRGDGFLAVTFIPEFDTAELDRPGQAEVVFVVDCSGSMGGASIEEAKKAMELCLRTMNEGDTFNICRFGSNFEMMCSGPVVYSSESLKRALDYVQNIQADLGGTELLAPLQDVLQKHPPEGVIRQVILLTDGEISNEPVVITLAQKHSSANRIFTFGIGSACSAHLVQGLARATGGAAEFISRGERIQDKVLRTFSRMATPMVSDVTVDWGKARVQQASEFVPPIFDGDATTVFAKVTGDAPERVILRCEIGNCPKEWPVDIPVANASGNTLATLWARHRIRSLEESPEQAATYARRRRGSASDVLIELSRRYNILCSFTSFVAIEHRSVQDRTQGLPELRRVPVMLAEGWGGIDASQGTLAMCSSPRSMLFEAELSDGCEPTIRFRMADKATEEQSDLEAILRCQEANGSFAGCWSGNIGDIDPIVQWASELIKRRLRAKIILEEMLDGLTSRWPCNPDEIRRIVEQVHDLHRSYEHCPDHDSLVHTLVALLVLRTRHTQSQSLWGRAYQKGIRYVVQSIGGTDAEIETRVEAWKGVGLPHERRARREGKMTLTRRMSWRVGSTHWSSSGRLFNSSISKGTPRLRRLRASASIAKAWCSG